VHKVVTVFGYEFALTIAKQFPRMAVTKRNNQVSSAVAINAIFRKNFMVVVTEVFTNKAALVTHI
jgi:hypothetical protein